MIKKDMLNENEIKVLKAIADGHENAGGDFTYADEIICGLTTNQIKGYLSQLVQKKYISISEEFEQINMYRKSIKIIPDLEDYCSVY
jgi:hypothetical protein